MENLLPRLEGSIVRLEPLREEHAEELWEAAQAPEIWAWLADLGSDRQLFDLWLELSLEAASSGKEGPLVTRAAGDGQVIGSSRYLNLRPADRVVEIGWTWLNPSAWRSGANVEAKLLMMRHAFEALGCVRVEFKTDARNERSRAALAALPARFEGILRKHMIVPTVGQRDSAYFSVIDEEWPRVQESLEWRLARGAAAASGSPDGAKASRSGSFTLRETRESADVEALEPIWNALQEHHVEVTPDLGPRTPERSLPEAWSVRRGKYETWLRDPNTFFLVAEADGEPIGYACVTVGPPYASWRSGERLAELETLSILPEWRGAGVGTALLDAAWECLAELGVEDMQIVTTSTNSGAKRFYERHGFARNFDVYYAKRPDTTTPR